MHPAANQLRRGRPDRGELCWPGQSDSLHGRRCKALRHMYCTLILQCSEYTAFQIRLFCQVDRPINDSLSAGNAHLLSGRQAALSLPTYPPYCNHRPTLRERDAWLLANPTRTTGAVVTTPPMHCYRRGPGNPSVGHCRLSISEADNHCGPLPPATNAHSCSRGST